MELDFVALSAIVGALLPLVISLVKGANMTKGAKQVIAGLTSLIAAIVVVGADLGWAFTSWSEFLNMAFVSFGLIFAEAQTFYTGFWEDRAIEVRLSQFGSN